MSFPDVQIIPDSLTYTLFVVSPLPGDKRREVSSMFSLERNQWKYEGNPSPNLSS